MAKKLINTEVKLGEGSLLKEAVREHILDSDFVFRGSCYNANDANKVGSYDVGTYSTNVPGNYGVLNVFRRFADSTAYLWQEYRHSNDTLFTRTCWNGVWTSWKNRG